MKTTQTSSFEVTDMSNDNTSYERNDGVVVEVGDWLATVGLTAADSDVGVVQLIEITTEGVRCMVGWDSGVVTEIDLRDEGRYDVYTGRAAAMAALDAEVA